MAWGRVALLLAAEKAENHLDDIAKCFHYTRDIQEHSEEKQPKKPDPDKQLADLDLGENTPPKTNRKSRFWRIERITELENTQKKRPKYLDEPTTAIPETSGTYQFDLPDPIANLAMLTPLIFNALGYEFTGSRINRKRLIKQISQGKPLKKLPRKQEKRWPLHLTIILDKHPKLFPYWHDFDVIAEQLETLLGENNVTTIQFKDNITHKACLQRLMEEKQVINNTSVLILSDLYDHNNNGRYWDFRELLHNLKSKGCKILSLSPAQRSPTDKVLYHPAKLQSLSQQGGMARQVKQQAFKLPIATTAIEEALTILAPLPLVDIGLLRKLRQTFQWGNAALEGILWNEPRVIRIQNYLGITLNDEARKIYLKQFYKRPESEQKQLWGIVNKQHESAYQGLKLSESLQQSVLSKEHQTHTLKYYQSLLATIKQAKVASKQSALKQQLRTLLRITPSVASESNQQINELLHEIYAIAFEDELRSGELPDHIPEWLRLNKLNWIQDHQESTQKKVWNISQKTFSGEIEISEEPSANNLVFQVISHKQQPAFLQFTDNSSRQVIKKAIKITQQQSLIITTQDTEIRLQSIKRPEFAVTVGRSQNGVFIETRVNEPESRVYWYPEEFRQTGEHFRAVWFPENPMRMPSTGRDQYGIYLDWSYKNITQRFRWIEPNTFLMGSPEDETGRYDDETQHQVTLTQGYWLAETTVTQAFWQTVMGENPSHFTAKQTGLDSTDNHPVEQISWDDAKAFIKKLNQYDSNRDFRLPTEAEWENGCRANTQTAFNFGNKVDLSKVNYSGIFDESGYADDALQRTSPIKNYDCNDWGLYEMHGNVWEWCQDYWVEDLGKEPVTDPETAKESSDRVLRGGGWSSGGRFVRSAVRNFSSPVNRLNLIGLRLALGQPSFSLQNKKQVAANVSSGRTVPSVKQGAVSTEGTLATDQKHESVFKKLLKPFKK